jgi:BlaI family transcriptional regulator, penicillinase repressor
MHSSQKSPRNLGQLEHLVMDFIWSHGPATAEQVREALASKHPMKESTARTIVRRLEAKGYLTHRVEGRTHVYAGAERPQSVAARAVSQIVERLCGGSVERLLVGMVNHDMIDERELQRLARNIARRKGKAEED